MLVIEIPYDVTSANSLHGRHWSIEHRHKKRLRDMVWLAMIRHERQGSVVEITKHAEKKWKIKATITRVYSGRQRQMDYDNMVRGFKRLVDALVYRGLAYDDSPQYWECTYRQERGNESKTSIILEVDND